MKTNHQWVGLQDAEDLLEGATCKSALPIRQSSHKAYERYRGLGNEELGSNPVKIQHMKKRVDFTFLDRLSAIA